MPHIPDNVLDTLWQHIIDNTTQVFFCYADPGLDGGETEIAGLSVGSMTNISLSIINSYMGGPTVRALYLAPETGITPNRLGYWVTHLVLTDASYNILLIDDDFNAYVGFGDTIDFQGARWNMPLTIGAYGD